MISVQVQCISIVIEYFELDELSGKQLLLKSKSQTRLQQCLQSTRKLIQKQILTQKDNIQGEDRNIAQLQFTLENERKKFREVKDKYQQDLDNERKYRIQFQNKLIKLKDQFSRKEVMISQLQFKINNLLHQNQDISIENDRLKHELTRLEELYGGKIHQLEGQLEIQTRNFQETTLQYNVQFEKFKKEGQEYVQQLTFQFQRKIKGLEQKVRSLDLLRKDLTAQNKKINDTLVSNKLNFQQQVRDLKNKAREDEAKRSQQLNRTFQQKVRMIEQSKQILLRKNQQLLKAIQEKDREISQMQNNRGEQVEKLRQDCTDLNQQNNQMSYMLARVKQQLADKENIIANSLSSNSAELNTLKKQIEQKRQENVQLTSQIKEIKLDYKQSENNWQMKRRELVDRVDYLEGQAKKYRDQYNHICNMLKDKINNAIDNVSFKK